MDVKSKLALGTLGLASAFVLGMVLGRSRGNVSPPEDVSKTLDGHVSQPHTGGPIEGDTSAAPQRTLLRLPEVADETRRSRPSSGPSSSASVRPNVPSAKEEREELLKSILESGPAQAWSKHAERAFEAGGAILPSELASAFKWGPIRCAAAGCVRDLTYESAGMLPRVDEIFLTRGEESPLRDWQGWIRRSPPVPAENGRLVVTIALMKPGGEP